MYEKSIKFLNSKEKDVKMDDKDYFIVGALYCLVCSLSSCYFITFNTEKCQKRLCSLTKSWRGATNPSHNGFCSQIAFCPKYAPCRLSACKTSCFCLTQYIWSQINNWPSASLKTKSGIYKHCSKPTKKKGWQTLRCKVHKRKIDKWFTIWGLPKNCATTTAIEFA